MSEDEMRDASGAPVAAEPTAHGPETSDQPPDEPGAVADGPPEGQTDGSAPGASRGWRIAAVVAVVAAAVSMGMLGSLLVFGGTSDVPQDVEACVLERDFTDEDESTSGAGHKGGADPEDARTDVVEVDGNGTGRNCPPAGATITIGLVEKSTDGGFTIRMIERGRLTDSVELFVRAADRQYIDVAHAQTHASLGQPVRVYTREIEGRESVVYMDDPPLVT